MIRSAVILLVILVAAVSIHSVSARNPQVLKDPYSAIIGIDEEERGGRRKLSSSKSGKGSKTAKHSKDGSMRLLLLVNEFGSDDSDNYHKHDEQYEKPPRLNIIRRRGLDGSKSSKGSKKAKGSKDGSMRLLLSEFGV
jgi:hypothetical protein